MNHTAGNQQFYIMLTFKSTVPVVSASAILLRMVFIQWKRKKSDRVPEINRSIYATT